jgi:hypothetical protein
MVTVHTSLFGEGVQSSREDPNMPTDSGTGVILSTLDGLDPNCFLKLLPNLPFHVFGFPDSSTVDIKY